MFALALSFKLTCSLRCGATYIGFCSLCADWVVRAAWKVALRIKAAATTAIAIIAVAASAVKAFNTVLAQNQSTAKVGAEQLSAFVAGDDETEKRVVMQLVANIGFDPIDVGTLRSGRYLEPMGMLLISLGYDLGMGTNMGIKLIKG